MTEQSFDTLAQLNAMYERTQYEPVSQVSHMRSYTYLLRISENARGFRRGPSPLASRRTKPFVLKTKIKSLSRVVLASCCAEDCCICMDKHIKIHTITTSCGHEFGKKCYLNWLTAANSNQCCPVCRNQSPSLVSYRVHATKKFSTFMKG